MHKNSMRLLAASLTATAACSPQANEEYLGEPLLRMRGQVSTQALSTPQPIVPALCFFEETEGGILELDIFPEEIQAAFKQSITGAPSSRVHIVDAHAIGQFPAEFKVDVYKPPADAVLAAKFSGEPRMAVGLVCAVQAEHQPIAQWIGSTGHFMCDHPFPESHCSFAQARRTQDGSRLFYETRECPNFSAPDEQCQVVRGGDETLLSETGGFENVVAMAGGVQVVYLAAPAPAGSYTAYTLGAPNGLSAGYHVLKDADPEQLQAQGPARNAARRAAVAETNERFGTNYPFAPSLGWFDDGTFATPPPHILDAYQRTLARIEMETIPLLVREELGPDDTGLTLDLKPQDTLPPLPPPHLMQPPKQ